MLETGKALRVPRAVNNGWRFTARIQVSLQQGSQKSVFFCHKNQDISKSVSSIGTGLIFLASLGHDLSRNAFVVFVYAFQKKFDRSKGFCMTPKKSKIFNFFEFSQNESRSFDRVFKIIPECSRRILVMVIRFFSSKKEFEKVDFSMSAWQILKSFSQFRMKINTIECCSAAIRSQFGDEI